MNEFAALLAESEVRAVADVRSIPRSRTNPQFNADTFPQALAANDVDYRHIAALGGLRGRPKSETPSPNAWWRVESFRNYADYALTPAFAEGLAELVRFGTRRRCAIMCAEAVWWRCHRRIITDYLLAAGHRVRHIMGPGHVDDATLTAAAVLRDGAVLYPAA